MNNPLLGDRDTFIQGNRKLVYKIANRYRKLCFKRSIDFEDIISEGMIGLLYAYEHFEDRGFAFSTYAVPAISRKIQQFIRDRGDVVRKPRKMHDLAVQIYKERLLEDAPEEIAKRLNCTVDEAIGTVNHIRKNDMYLDKTTVDGKATAYDWTPVQDDNSQLFVQKFMKQLDSRQQKMLEMKIDGYSQQEIGKAFGLSQAQVCRILKQIAKEADIYFRQGGKEIPIPKREAELNAGGQGEVYTLPAEELENLREGMLTRQVFLESVAAGESIAGVGRAWGIIPATLYGYANRWGLKGLTPEKAREILESSTTESMNDAVNQPSHYTAGGLETIDYLEAKLTKEEFSGYCRGNVLKYVSRFGLKDLEKAHWYLERLIRVAEKI